jgi:hypothetical protein
MKLSSIKVYEKVLCHKNFAFFFPLIFVKTINFTNAVEAIRLYMERFPQREIPDSHTFTAAVQHLRGTFVIQVTIWNSQEVIAFWKLDLKLYNPLNKKQI